MTYDHNGNMTTDQSGNTYTYDAWNRMMTMTPADGAATYHETYYMYNAVGERVSELDGIISGTTSTLLVVNDGNIQRSMIDSLTLVFQEPVTLSAGALALTSANQHQSVSGSYSYSVDIEWSNPSGDDKTYLISFTHSGTPDYFLSFGSLANDNYTLTVNHSDTSGAGAPSSDVTYDFSRINGDYFGGGCNFSDLVYVVQNFDGTTPADMWFVDSDGETTTDFNDLVAVVQDFNHTEVNSGAIYMGASQTAGPGTGRIATPFVPREYYYSDSQQLLEEDAPVTTEDDSGTPSVGFTMAVADQYSWGLAYQNELIARDAYTVSTIGTLGGVLTSTSQRLYALQDANWNVVALVNTSGTVVERFDYTPYGTQRVLTASGGVNVNGDAYGWNVGFQGMYTDSVNPDLVVSESRVEYVPLGIWMTQDPSGYTGSGPNLYWAFDDNPISFVDPLGLAAAPIDPSSVPILQRGPILPNGQPEGLPSIPGGWKLGPPSNPNNLTAPYRWNPANPSLTKGPNGAQPNGSWDFKDGYWRYNPGDGSPTQHTWPDGTPVAPEDFNNGRGYQPKPDTPAPTENGPTAPRPYPEEPQPPKAPGFWLKLWNVIEDIGDHVKEPFIIIIDPDEFMREEQRELNSGNIV